MDSSDPASSNQHPATGITRRGRPRRVQRFLELGDHGLPFGRRDGFFETVGKLEDKHRIVRVPVPCQGLVIDPLGRPALGFGGPGNQLEMFIKGRDDDFFSIESPRYQEIAQGFPGVVLAVVEKKCAYDRGTFHDPVGQLALIGVGRVVADTADRGPDFELLAVDPNVFLPLVITCPRVPGA